MQGEVALTLILRLLRQPCGFPGMSLSFESFLSGVNEIPHDTSCHLALKSLLAVTVKAVDCRQDLNLSPNLVGDSWLAEFVKKYNLVLNSLNNFLDSRGILLMVVVVRV